MATSVDRGSTLAAYMGEMPLQGNAGASHITHARNPVSQR
jgi:hypothetical protein